MNFNKFKIFLKKLFSINFVDNHLMIYILTIRIKIKLAPCKVDLSIKENLLNKVKRNPEIIFSLTSFPQRIDLVHKTIITLLKQSVPADKVILWLAEEQFPNKENDLPKTLLDLIPLGLTIKWTTDTRSYKKLIPALKEFPNDIIITFDDDIYYPNNTVELLYDSYKENPNCIHTNRIRRLDLDKETIISKSAAENYWLKFDDLSYFNKITGCGGTLYPPNSLDKRVFDEDTFKNLIPTQDDVWFWAMAILNNTKIKTVASFKIQLPTIEDSQQFGLCKINKGNSIGNNSLESAKIVAKHYPEILEKLKEEKYNS